MAIIFCSEWSWYFKNWKTKIFTPFKSFLHHFLHIQQHKFEKKKHQHVKNPFWTKKIIWEKNYQTFRGDSVDFRVVIGYFSDRKSRATGKIIPKGYVHRFLRSEKYPMTTVKSTESPLKSLIIFFLNNFLGFTMDFWHVDGFFFKLMLLNVQKIGVKNFWSG